MNIEIENMAPGLPCELETFKINDIEADIEDFGETERSGSCMNSTCSQIFRFKLPTEEVLKKYGINLKDYSEICDRLKDELHVSRCGMCS